MKNLLFAGIVGFIISTSCSSTKTAPTFTQYDFMKMKGNWQITSVDYDKNYSVKPFDEGADAQCWVGSQWKLVPNNWTGSYTLNGDGSCPSITQPIKFEVVNGGTQFQFKKVAEGTKAKQNTVGYILNFTSFGESNFSLEDNVGGVKIVYNFQKITE
ncbi:MAG: lipocalin family protein [Flavobacteriaceae bacterium]|jgi:hypothetical protein|nr:lipocalin family protein [Flavobacteriaceae bacterium]